MNLANEMRQILRLLRKRLGFTATVILTLSLGIGANTAIFTLVYAVILKPLPFDDPKHLVYVWENYPKGARYEWGSDSSYITVRPGTYQEWKAQSGCFSHISGYFRRNVLLTGSSRAVEVRAHEVDEGFFETLGVRPLEGRTFGSGDFSGTDRQMVVLSYELWKKIFQGDRKIVGRKMSIANAAYTVIGVMPAGFYPTRSDKPQLWLPLVWQPNQKYSKVTWDMVVVARLKQGVSLAQAQIEMDVISQRLSATYPKDYDNMSGVVTPVTGYTYSQHEKLFFLLLAAVSLLLLIACTNVANLVLAHATEREREFTIRVALGSPRWRLIRQLLLESLLLAGAGAILGVVFAELALPSLVSLMPRAGRIPRIESISLNWPVLAFTLCLTAFTGVLFGLVPAIRSSQVNLNNALKEAGRGSAGSRSTRRFSNLLIVGEMAISLVLLAVAGLLIRAFVTLLHLDPGFSAENVLTMSLTIPDHAYGAYDVGGNNRARAQLYQELERRVAVLPAVKSASVTQNLPLLHSFDPWAMRIEGLPPDPSMAAMITAAHSKAPGLYYHGDVSIETVSPSFFQTFRIPLLKGRYLSDRDAADAPLAAMVSQTTASRYFKGQDPVGRKIVVDMTSYFPELTVVGVVADSRLLGLDTAVAPLIFWSMPQMPSRNCWLAVLTSRESTEMANEVEQEVRRLNPDIAISEVRTMNSVVTEALWQQRLSAILLALFAALATMLAAAGIYGVFSYMISCQAKEIGIRMALGATTGQILFRVLRSAWQLAITGIAVGALTTLVFGRLSSNQISTSTQSELGMIALVAGGLFLVATASCWVPARRAARVDPVVALRES